MTNQVALEILNEWTKGPSLLRHAFTVSQVMRKYAQLFGENEEMWAVTGLLHDADYEAFPEDHPNRIVTRLQALGEDQIAYAISAHYSKWGNTCKSLMDKALLACDELTGFIVACAQVRPQGFEGMKSRSVIKKLKQKSFAAKVDRDEIYFGVALIDIPINQHIDFIIKVLQECKELNIDS